MIGQVPARSGILLGSFDPPGENFHSDLKDRSSLQEEFVTDGGLT